MDKKLKNLYEQYKKLSQGGKVREDYSDSGRTNNIEEKQDADQMDITSFGKLNDYPEDPSNQQIVKQKTADKDSLEKSKGYSDGGDVESDDSFMSDLGKALKKTFGTPEEEKPPQKPSLEDKYSKIRERNSTNATGETSEENQPYLNKGGKVPKLGSGERFKKLENKLSHQKGIKDPAALAASIGRKKFGAKKFNKLAHMNKGGEVGYADGTEEPVPEATSDEDFQKHLQDLKDQGYDVKDVQGDEQDIVGKLPAKESDVEETPDVEKASVEEPYENEEVASEAKSQEPESEKNDDEEEDRQLASEDEEKSQEAPGEEKEEETESSSPEEGQQITHELGKSNEQPVKAPEESDLQKAQSARDWRARLQGIESGSALIGAGIARANPDQALKVIAEGDKYVNLPVEEYKEKMANKPNDPNSDISKAYQSYAVDVLKLDPKKVDGMSAAAFEKIMPLALKKSAQEFAIQKFQQTQQFNASKLKFQQDNENQRANNANDAKIQAANILGDARKFGPEEANKRQSKQLSAKFVHDINNDPLIKPSRQNVGSLEKSMSLLSNQTIPVTPQVLADAEQDIASGMQVRGMGGSEGKINRTQLITVGRQLAEARQKYLNQPDIDLRKTDPVLVKTIFNTAKALRDDYNTTISQAKNDLASQYKTAFNDDPKVMSVLNQYTTTPVGHYSPGQTISYKGQNFQVAPDGDTLIPTGKGQ